MGPIGSQICHLGIHVIRSIYNKPYQVGNLDGFPAPHVLAMERECSFRLVSTLSQMLSNQSLRSHLSLHVILFQEIQVFKKSPAPLQLK